MIRQGIVVHGGVGAPPSWNDGCEAAAEAGWKRLAEGAGSLGAVLAAVIRLEDDGRFNAGRGSALRMDGRTIESDAAVMDSAGRLGAVAALRNVAHPVRVARLVMDTPHVLLAGEGAWRLARRNGLAEPFEPSPQAQARFEEIRAALARRDPSLRAAWRDADWAKLWNFDRPLAEILPCDTVGAVALDETGILAAAVSTGGASPMLLGRVGDSPLPGCGFWCGPAGAAVATGVGEAIIRRMLSRGVHDAVAHGEEPVAACERAVLEGADGVPLGVIWISRRGACARANREMACATRVEER